MIPKELVMPPGKRPLTQTDFDNNPQGDGMLRTSSLYLRSTRVQTLTSFFLFRLKRLVKLRLILPIFPNTPIMPQYTGTRSR
jgi:hypothetical protein